MTAKLRSKMRSSARAGRGSGSTPRVRGTRRGSRPGSHVLLHLRRGYEVVGRSISGERAIVLGSTARAPGRASSRTSPSMRTGTVPAIGISDAAGLPAVQVAPGPRGRGPPDGVRCQRGGTPRGSAWKPRGCARRWVARRERKSLREAAAGRSAASAPPRDGGEGGDALRARPARKVALRFGGVT